MKLGLFSTLVICCILVVVVNGYAFRCGGEPIGRWDTKEKVSKYCGKPQRIGYERAFHEGRSIYAETWYYNCGEGDFVYAVSFYKDVVVKEEPKERGSGSSRCGR